MVIRHIFKSIGCHCTHICAIGKDGVDAITIRCRDFNVNGRAVRHCCVGRSHRAAVTNRRRHRKFVNGELGRNGMAFPNIRKRVAVSSLHQFAVHQQPREVPARFGSERKGGVIAASHRRRAGGRDGSAALDRSHDFVFVADESGRQRVVIRHIFKRVGCHCANIRAIGKDGVDAITIRCSDSDGNGRAVRHRCVGRSHQAAITSRRRHRKFVNGELGRNGMVFSDIRKRVAVSSVHRFAVHQQAREVPACFGSERKGGVIAASHRRRAGGCDSSVTHDRSRDFVFIRAEGGRQCVVAGYIIKRVGCVIPNIITIDKNRIHIITIIS